MTLVYLGDQEGEEIGRYGKYGRANMGEGKYGNMGVREILQLSACISRKWDILFNVSNL